MFAAEMVKEMRKAAGYSAATFGRRLGISARQVRRYESGEFDPPLSIAGLMARALGVPLDELYVHDVDAATAANGHGKDPAHTNGDDAASHSSGVAPALPRG